MTLANLANLYSVRNDISTALEKYGEAMKVYQLLAEDNPNTYLPDVAATLHNLVVLQKAKNLWAVIGGQTKTDDAITIYRIEVLVNKSP